MRTLVAIPCMDEMDSAFVQSYLGMIKVGDVEQGIVSGTLVYEARDRLADKAVRDGFDYVLWFDSDMVFRPTTMMDLMAHGKDIVCGLYCARRPPYVPVMYRREGDKLVNITEYPDRLVEIDGCGFGAVLTRTEVLAKCFDKFGTCFLPMYGYGEDLSFCNRAKELGYKMWCDPNLKVGHIAKTIITYDTYKEYKNAR